MHKIENVCSQNCSNPDVPGICRGRHWPEERGVIWDSKRCRHGRPTGLELMGAPIDICIEDTTFGGQIAYFVDDE